MPTKPASSSPVHPLPDASAPTSEADAADTEPRPDPGGHRSVLSLLRSVQQGAVTVEALSLDDRRSCVAHLSSQGLSAPEIAEALRIHERTVYRDIAAIRRTNALSPNPLFTREIAGMILRRAEASSGKLLRLARDAKSPPHVQVDAEAKSFEVLIDAVQTLQKMGLLPTAEAEGAGGAGAPALGVLTAEIERLLACVGGTDKGEAVPDAGLASALDELQQLRTESLTLSLAMRLDVLKARIAAGSDPAREGDAAQLPPSPPPPLPPPTPPPPPPS